MSAVAELDYAVTRRAVFDHMNQVCAPMLLDWPSKRREQADECTGCTGHMMSNKVRRSGVTTSIYAFLEHLRVMYPGIVVRFNDHDVFGQYDGPLAVPGYWPDVEIYKTTDDDGTTQYVVQAYYRSF